MAMPCGRHGLDDGCRLHFGVYLTLTWMLDPSVDVRPAVAEAQEAVSAEKCATNVLEELWRCHFRLSGRVRIRRAAVDGQSI